MNLITPLEMKSFHCASCGTYFEDGGNILPLEEGEKRWSGGEDNA